MRNQRFSVLIFMAGLLWAACVSEGKKESLSKYVDPFIGTDGSVETGHGNTFPGAAWPFGMVQLSPDNGKSGPFYCSGYFYDDDRIAGFSHTHLSGTGAGDLADISFMPTAKEIKEEYFTQPKEFIEKYCKETGLDITKYYDPERHDEFQRNFLLKYMSRFSHEQEKASPGYYYVKLLDDDIDVELTVTEFTGFHRYTFNKNGHDPKVILNLGFAINRGRPVDTYIEQCSPTLFVGYRFSDGWAKKQRVFFAMEFDQAPVNFMTFNAKDSISGGKRGKGLQAVFEFDKKKTETVLMKVGISSADIDGALADLHTADQFGWDFDKTHEAVQDKWDEELARVRVTTDDEELKRILYTALYHTYLSPYRYSDVNGRYKGFNHQTVRAEGYEQYTVFSLWDTFRAQMPWLIIMYPDLYNNLVKSMLAKYEQTGILPYWEIMGSEGGSMIGYHAVPVIADAILKDIGDFDRNLALKAMVDVSNHDRKGVGVYIKYHYVPADLEKHGTVSKTLEFAYDDWCIAQAAKHLGADGIYNQYMARSQYYKNVFDPDYRLMRGKNSDGTWYEPFHPRYGQYGNQHFVEANAWQYSFFVPHNTDSLIAMMGGEQGFEMMMDSLFGQTSEILGLWTEDIVGRIGQYAHGNEPDHHVAYLYDFIGKEHKTRFRVHQIMDSLYTDAPDGLCGNDDCGQMSAWYVFSALGFYPVNPLDGRYYIGSPRFEKTEISLPDGKTFTILAHGVSEKNIYIKSKKLNGRSLERPYITWNELKNGGTLEFEMTATP